MRLYGNEKSEIDAIQEIRVLDAGCGSGRDLKEFSNTLKLMVDKHYQPSASIEVKNMAKNELNEDFEKLMNAISGTPEGNYA